MSFALLCRCSSTCKSLLTTGALACALSVPTVAQAAADDAPASTADTPAVASEEAAPADAKVQTTQAVVVSATRVETPVEQVGSSITTIDSNELERKQPVRVIDALTSVPGLQVRSNGGLGGNTSFFMRGTDSDHTMFLLDGIPMHDVSSTNGAHAINHLSADGLERIEVLRGPQSTLYGSDAIGGVVNLVTRKGSGKPTFTYSQEVGSFDTYIERAGFSGGDDFLNYHFNLTRIDANPYSSRNTNTETDPYQNTSFGGRVGMDFSENFAVDLVGRVIDADVEFDDGVVGVSQTEYQQYIFKVEPRLVLADGRWEQRLSLWVNRVERDNTGIGFSYPSDFNGTNFGVDWQHTLYLTEAHTVTAGFEYEAQDANFFSPASPNRLRANTRNFAFYLQDQIKLLEDLFVTLGVRVDDHRDFGTEATYRAAGVYHLRATGTAFRASVGSGFKAPTLSELYDTSFGSNNPNLQAEHSVGFDAGVEQQLFGDLLVVGATYFQNEVSDNIVAVFNGIGFVNTNVEDTRTRGVETFLTITPSENIHLRFHYTYTDTEALAAASFGITQGARLLRRPLHAAGADLSFDFLEKRGNVTVGLIYVGDRDDLDPATFTTVNNPDYLVVNVSGSYKLCAHAELFARVENLFNHNYEDVLGFNNSPVAGYGGVKFTF